MVVYVAHYGLPQLKGARHWAILVPKDGQLFTAYQVSGSTQTYEVKPPEDIQTDKSSAYLGKVEVGQIAEGHRPGFQKTVLAVPVTKNSTSWNCQNWVVAALSSAKAAGFGVNAYSQKELQDLLAKSAK